MFAKEFHKVSDLKLVSPNRVPILVTSQFGYLPVFPRLRTFDKHAGIRSLSVG